MSEVPLYSLNGWATQVAFCISPFPACESTKCTTNRGFGCGFGTPQIVACGFGKPQIVALVHRFPVNPLPDTKRAIGLPRS